MQTVRSKFTVAIGTAYLLVISILVLGGVAALAQTQHATTQGSSITIPAGARIQVALLRPIFAKTASAGESLYVQTTFPVTVDGRTAVPAGSFVMGRLVKLTRPTRRVNRSELQMLFTNIIYANGYVAALPGAAISSTASMDATAGAGEALIAVTVQVSQRNDVLLDNGAPIEITLGAPLTVDTTAVAAAIPLSRAPVPGQFRTASLCRTIPGSPGTTGSPDTVIPGSPGTPDTVIPGGPGMPDTVIPGTPATPSTTIPGTPGMAGSPEIPCPLAPIVISSTPVNGKPN